MMRTKMVKSILAGICAAALLTGCGSGYASIAENAGTSTAYDYAAEETYVGNVHTNASEDAGTSAAYDYKTEGAYTKDADNDEKENGTAGDSAADSQEAETNETDTEGEAISEQKLIYTADITLQTKEFGDTFKAVKEAISKVGGFVESESTTDSAWNWYYSDYSKSSGTLRSYITVRVPSAKYREFLNLLERTDGRITNKSEYVQNITKAYNDQSILIQSLEKQETRLMEMMDKAETIEDMIAIESRLSEVQTQLNQAKNILSGYNTDISYSTVNVTIEEVMQYNPQKVQQTFMERLKDTFERSWRDFGEFLQHVALTVVYLLPAIIVVIIILIVMRPFLAKRKAKRRERMEKMSYTKQPEYNSPIRNRNEKKDALDTPKESTTND